MIASGRSWRARSVQHPVTLALLVVLSGRALLLAADPIALERGPILHEGDRCELRNGSTGICRQTNQCEWVRNKPLHEQKLVTCSSDQSISIICCPEHSEPRYNSTTVKRISILECEQYPTSSRLAEHMLIGTTVQLGEFPYMAALGYEWPNSSHKDTLGIFRYGASLISSNYLLTAAHCLWKTPLFARLGVVELQPETVVNEPLDIAIKKAIRHPAFRDEMFHNDIALLELEERISDWSFIKPVCLYPYITAGKSLRPKQTLSVIGWADNHYFENNMNRLMKRNVTIIEHNECNKMIMPSRRRPAGLLPGELCGLARNENNETICDTYAGDSGGPLELNVDGRQYLVGIVSHGYLCVTEIKPSLYIEVAHYLDWIESIVWPDV